MLTRLCLFGAPIGIFRSASSFSYPHRIHFFFPLLRCGILRNSEEKKFAAGGTTSTRAVLMVACHIIPVFDVERLLFLM